MASWKNHKQSKELVTQGEADFAASFEQHEIAEIIMDEFARDTRLHLAISGEWGSGKTTIARLVQQKMPENTIVAWYQPWKYQTDEVALRRTMLQSMLEAAKEGAVEVSAPGQRYFQAEDSTAWRGQLGAWFASFSLALGIAVVALLAWAGLAAWSQTSALVENLPGSGAANLVVLGSLAIAFIGQIPAFQSKSQTEPALREIDQFEKTYAELRDKLQEKERQLLVIVDDLDRCEPEHMKRVLTALATYLDTSKEPSGAVGFLAAIDESKILDALQSDGAPQGGLTSRPAKPNLIQKYFTRIVVVPPITREQTRLAVEYHSRALGLFVNRNTEQGRLTSLFFETLEANYRVIKAVMDEAAWLKRFSSVSHLKENNDVRAIVSDAVLLTRVAAIRELGDPIELRRVVDYPGVWRAQGLHAAGLPPRLLFDAPVIGDGGVDPRALIGLGQPRNQSFVITNKEQFTTDFRNGLYDIVDRSVDLYSRDTIIDFARQILKERGNHPVDSTNLMDGAFRLLDRVIGPSYKLSATQEFSDELVAKSKISAAPFTSANDPAAWVSVAAHVNPNLLKDFVIAHPYLYNGDARRLTKDRLAELAADREIPFEIYANLEEIRNDPHDAALAMRRVARICPALSSKDQSRYRRLLISILDSMDFSQDSPNPRAFDALDKSGWNQQELVSAKAMSRELLAEHQIEMVDEMVARGWPAP